MEPAAPPEALADAPVWTFFCPIFRSGFPIVDPRVRPMLRTIAVIFILTALAVVPAGCAGVWTAPSSPQAEKGVLDLTGKPALAQNFLRLDGEWELYWDRMLTPKDFADGAPAPTGYFDFPGTWSHFKIDGQKLPAHGHATFRLTVKLGSHHPHLAAKLLDFSSAYRLYINGAAVTQDGIPATNKDLSVPAHQPKTIVLPSDTDRIELLLQVSNYHYWKGGPWEPIVIGPVDMIFRARENAVALSLSLAGGILVMAFYHLCLFLLRPRDRSPLYFGLFCLLIVLRILSTSERYLTTIWPEMPWELLMMAEHMSFFVSVTVFAFYVRSIFPTIVSWTVIVIVGVAGALSFLTALFFPADLFSHLVPFWQALTLALVLYGCYLLYRMLKERLDGAGPFGLGFLALSLAALNDILSSNELVDTPYLVPVAIFFFVLSQAYLLSSRLARSYKTVQEYSAGLDRLNQLKDEFLANTSHELKTPLTGIIGLAESMVDGSTGTLPDKTKANLSMIAASGRRLTGMVNDLLDFSRLKHLDLKLDVKAVDLRAQAELVLAVIAPLVRGERVRLINDIPEDIPNVLGDENRVQQILYNLVGNAVKFTSQGSISVEADLKNSQVEVTVRDTGEGIPEDRLQDIFNSYEQADPSRPAELTGTGLGLNITRHLVELHGGSIRVVSTPGRGSAFMFTLPVSLDPPPQCVGPVVSRVRSSWPHYELTEGEIPVETEGETARPGTDRVLVVDDEPINLQVIENHLSLENTQVLTAASGEEALSLLENEENQPDLILLDIMLPGMSGLDFCREIRKKYSFLDLPVILLTAKDQVSDLVLGFESGANDFLSKPFTRRELAARIKTQITLSRLNRDLKTAHAEMAEHSKNLERNVKERTDELRQANRELQRLASLDGLTQIANRRFFAEKLDQLWRQHQRQQTPLSLIMCDIDFFKKYNDAYGHQMGDDALVAVAAAISNMLKRPMDQVARYGGEEFAVLLPDTPAKGAYMLAENIRLAVAAMQIEHRDSTVAPIVTLSLGVATLIPQTDILSEKLVEAADRALYKAKSQGRNKVVAAGDNEPASEDHSPGLGR